MIQGAIEMVHETLVSGWIYAHVGEGLRDQLVLAFSGPRCVGQGRVDVFRRDLLDAGLGDGYCGFHFPITLEPGEHPASVVIRPANCDTALIQARSQVGPAINEPVYTPQPALKARQSLPDAATTRQSSFR